MVLLVPDIHCSTVQGEKACLIVCVRRFISNPYLLEVFKTSKLGGESSSKLHRRSRPGLTRKIDLELPGVSPRTITRRESRERIRDPIAIAPHITITLADILRFPRPASVFQNKRVVSRWLRADCDIYNGMPVGGAAIERVGPSTTNQHVVTGPLKCGRVLTGDAGAS